MATHARGTSCVRPRLRSRTSAELQRRNGPSCGRYSIAIESRRRRRRSCAAQWPIWATCLRWHCQGRAYRPISEMAADEIPCAATCRVLDLLAGPSIDGWPIRSPGPNLFRHIG